MLLIYCNDPDKNGKQFPVNQLLYQSTNCHSVKAAFWSFFALLIYSLPSVGILKTSSTVAKHSKG